jgi:hypothetical protein
MIKTSETFKYKQLDDLPPGLQRAYMIRIRKGEISALKSYLDEINNDLQQDNNFKLFLEKQIRIKLESLDYFENQERELEMFFKN